MNYSETIATHLHGKASQVEAIIHLLVRTIPSKTTPKNLD